MTIAVCVKVNDGLVLAADSATTLYGRDQAGNSYIQNVYNNANKVFNLCKGLPVGAVTWGGGSIGAASIATLSKDLRRRFAGEDAAHLSWKLDSNSYTIQAVADQFRTFFYDEMYVPAFASWTEKPEIGFLVAGYSAGAGLPGTRRTATGLPTRIFRRCGVARSVFHLH